MNKLQKAEYDSSYPPKPLRCPVCKEMFDNNGKGRIACSDECRRVYIRCTAAYRKYTR